MPGSRFKEFIDRAFLGNRGYDYQTGTWNRGGVTEGLIGGIGNAVVPGLGTIGRAIYDHYHNVGHPTQYTGGLSGGYSYQPPDFSGMLNAPDLNFHGYTGGDQYTPSTTTLNPYVPNVPVDGTLQPMDFTIHGTGGWQSGYTGGGIFTGNSSGGTLGGGSNVSFGNSGQVENNLADAAFNASKAAHMSGMSGDGGGGTGGGLVGLLAARRNGNTGIVPTTGGRLPPYLQPPIKTGGGGQVGG